MFTPSKATVDDGFDDGIKSSEDLLTAATTTTLTLGKKVMGNRRGNKSFQSVSPLSVLFARENPVLVFTSEVHCRTKGRGVVDDIVKQDGGVLATEYFSKLLVQVYVSRGRMLRMKWCSKCGSKGATEAARYCHECGGELIDEDDHLIRETSDGFLSHADWVCIAECINGERDPPPEQYFTRIHEKVRHSLTDFALLYHWEGFDPSSVFKPTSSGKDGPTDDEVTEAVILMKAFALLYSGLGQDAYELVSKTAIGTVEELPVDAVDVTITVSSSETS